jgi:hypothetical protein
MKRTANRCENRGSSVSDARVTYRDEGVSGSRRGAPSPPRLLGVAGPPPRDGGRLCGVSAEDISRSQDHGGEREEGKQGFSASVNFESLPGLGSDAVTSHNDFVVAGAAFAAAVRAVRLVWRSITLLPLLCGLAFK